MTDSEMTQLEQTVTHARFWDTDFAQGALRLCVFTMLCVLLPKFLSPLKCIVLQAFKVGVRVLAKGQMGVVSALLEDTVGYTIVLLCCRLNL